MWRMPTQLHMDYIVFGAEVMLELYDIPTVNFIERVQPKTMSKKPWKRAQNVTKWLNNAKRDTKKKN